MLRFLLQAVFATVICIGTVQAQGLSDVRAGNMAFKEGDLAKAVELYGSAIGSGDLGEDALSITYNNRGVVLGELGDFDAAIADYQSALELRPDDATTHKNLRVAFVRRGQVSQTGGDQGAALRDFGEAIAIQPDHYLAYFYRAQLYAERGDLELAQIDLERATMLEPDDPQAREALDQVEHDLALAREVGGGKARVADTTTAPTEIAPDAAGTAAPAETAEVSPAAGPVAPSTTAAGDTLDKAPATAATSAPARDAPSAAATTATPDAPKSLTPETEPAAPATPATVATPEPEPEAAPAPVFDVADASGESVKMRTVSDVNFRGGPSNDDASLGAVAEGTIVTVVGETLGWKHIILADGQRGFIYKRWLEPVGN